MTAYCRLTHDEIKFEGATCWVCALVKKNAELEEKIARLEAETPDKFQVERIAGDTLGDAY